MTDRELAEALLEELRLTRKALRELRHGDLVARLTEAERHAIADLVCDRIDERLASERHSQLDTPPARAARPKGRGIRGY
jgi:hypothetical protein